MAIYKSRLPSGYQEVEWIRSDGNQYIDFDIYPTSLTEIDLVFQLTSISANKYMFGVGVSGQRKNTMCFGIMWNDPAKLQTTFGLTYYDIDIGNSDLNKHTLVFNNSNHEVLLDGITKTTLSSIDFFHSYRSLTLFTISQSNIIGNPNYSLPSIIFSCKVKENGLLVRNFIPCYRKADNEIGLYDLVNGVFYTNQGTGTFAKGNDVLPQKIVKLYHGTQEIVKRYKGTQVIYQSRVLPAGFIECEYLESHGTEYIDTGLVGTEKTTVDLTIQNISTTLSSLVFGARQSAILNNFTLTNSNNGGLELDYGSYEDNRIGITNLNLLNKTNIKVIANTSFSAGNQTEPLTSVSFTTQTNLFIFNASGNQYLTQKYIGRLYTFKIYDNSVLVRNFIPCLDTTGTPCLYDTVSKTCFYNQGTGTFGYKVKVPSKYQMVEYIESSGTQYVDSGLIQNTSLVLGFEMKIRTLNANNYIGGYDRNSGFVFGAVSGKYRYYGNRPHSAWYEDIGTFDSSNVLIIKSYLENNAQHFDINGIIYNTGTEQGNSGYSIYLFSGNYEGTAWNNAQMRLYYSMLFNGLTLVRYFVPVYEKANGEIGLLDLVNNKFYGNAGTGTFTKGGDV